MQAAIAEHIKSVGENDSPLPRLSTGASVDTVAPEEPCSIEQCNPPSYLIVHLTIGQHTTPHVREESSENLANKWKIENLQLRIICVMLNL